MITVKLTPELNPEAMVLLYPQWLDGNSIVHFLLFNGEPRTNLFRKPWYIFVREVLSFIKNIASQYCPNSKCYHGTLRKDGNTSLVNCNKRGSVPVLYASIMHHNKQLQCKNRKKRIKRARERIRSFMTLHFGPSRRYYL